MTSLLPQYSMDEVSAAPTYSAWPDRSELTITRDGLPGPSSSQRYSYATKHITIDLGPKTWGTAYPCYGRNARVEGAVRLSGNPGNVKRVSVTLMARLATSTPQRGTRGQYVSTLMSRTIPLYVGFKAGPSTWGELLHFSIPLPTEININGGVSTMPPSFSAWDANFGAGCDVAYSVKVCMMRRSRGLRRHESMLIPILYLPKSCPSLTRNVPVARNNTLPRSRAYEYRETSKMEVAPCRWPISTKCNLEAAADTILISLPDITFTAGDSIPFKIIISSKDPSLSHLLGQHARLTLSRRVVVLPSSGRKKHIQTVEHGIAAGIFTDKQLKDDDTYVMSGNVKAGQAGKEASWCIADTARAEYVLRLSVNAPKHLAVHLSTVTHEKVVRLTTDPCGTNERELSATGGIPTPALGMHPVLTRDDSVSYANAFIC